MACYSEALKHKMFSFFDKMWKIPFWCFHFFSKSSQNLLNENKQSNTISCFCFQNNENKNWKLKTKSEGSIWMMFLVFSFTILRTKTEQGKGVSNFFFFHFLSLPYPAAARPVTLCHWQGNNEWVGRKYTKEKKYIYVYISNTKLTAKQNISNTMLNFHFFFLN